MRRGVAKGYDKGKSRGVRLENLRIERSETQKDEGSEKKLQANNRSAVGRTDKKSQCDFLL